MNTTSQTTTEHTPGCARLRVTPADLATLARHFELSPSRISPLPLLLSHTADADAARGIDDVLESARTELLDPEIGACLQPFADPRRVLVVQVAGYGEPRWRNPFKFYQTADLAADFSALHLVSWDAVELQFPFSASDIQAWLFLSMQSVTGNPLERFRIDGLGFLELVALLAALDAFKSRYASALTRRAPGEEDLLRFADIKAVIAEAVLNEDPRWTLAALYRFLDRRGPRIGAPGTGLRSRMPDDEELRNALAGLEKRSLLHLPENEDADAYALSPTLRTMAATLFQWEDFGGLHDTRLVETHPDERVYTENLIAFYSCAVTNWVLVAESATTDLGQGRPFSIASQSAAQLVSMLDGFLNAPEHEVEGETPVEPGSHKAAHGDVRPPRSPPPSPSPAFCEECGAKLEPDAKFCADCGTRVD